MSEYLIITAHPDDELLSCGGFIKQGTENGHKITVCCVTDKGTFWNRAFERSCQLLGATHYFNLMLPLFKNRDTRTLAEIDTEVVADVVRNSKARYLITHHLDGDIDFHEQHKAIAANKTIRKHKHAGFVGLPRVGLKPSHHMYSWAKARADWKHELIRGHIPLELRLKATLYYKLSKETVELKKCIAEKVYKLNKNYAMIEYPYEFFSAKG